jgi:hypothetical protein
VKPSSHVLHLGPIMVKRYWAHRHAPEVNPSVRAAREREGAGLLAAPGVGVATPWLIVMRPPILIRRWYHGTHPAPPEGIGIRELTALGRWIAGHRGGGRSIYLTGGNREPLEVTIRRLEAMSPNAAKVARNCADGLDLVHGDLCPSNIVQSRGGLVILDTESISIGSICWDIAHVVALILGPRHILVPDLLDSADLLPWERANALGFAEALAEAACVSR